MVQNPEPFEGKTLLELGSGVGITGIVLAKKVKIQKLVMTDYTDQVIANLKQNVEINKVSDLVDVQELDWERPKLGGGDAEIVPDVIFVADCVYDPELIDALTKVLKHFLARKNTCAYVASTHRNPTTFQYFLDTLGKLGISYKDYTPQEPLHEKSCMQWKYDTTGTIFLTYLYC
eukprot:TRINITY_DN9701_c0_g1_i2.p1 TRINITY_DN9701_c0_g1~~TRINITY_DN9701_c0_g1_i2.p1  ORF type:complete len:175 (+),score=35.98 TRINITY_DN9701_c0_g1_i2:101-625(+)